MINNNSHVFKIFSLIVAVSIIFNLVSCTKASKKANTNYIEYISSFYHDQTLNLFEFSENLDLESSIHLAFILNENNYKINDDNFLTLKNAFQTQILKSEYKLEDLYINNNLNIWSDYLLLLKQLNYITELNNLIDTNRKMLNKVTSTWKTSIAELNINENDDMLTRLNILLQLKNINNYVNDDIITGFIEQQIKMEFDKFISKTKNNNLSEEIIPAIYYFSNLGINELDEFKDQVFNHIDLLLYKIKSDNYNGYFFYLPFIYDVMEKYENSSFEKKYKEYNKNAINSTISKNIFDWNSLWIATCLTGDLLTSNDKKNLLNLMNINNDMDISQPQIIYLSDTYSNIYYYLKLAYHAQINISSTEIECINKTLKNIKDTVKRDCSIKECYYSLKLKEFNFINTDYLLNNQDITTIIQKFTDINSINLHDAGNVYYLMLCQNDFKIVELQIIEKILNMQKEIILKENIDSSIVDSLTYMFDLLKNNKKLDNSIFDNLDTFQEKIYFISKFTIKLTSEQKDKLINLIENYAVKYGYSSQLDNKKLELEATYRMVEALSLVN